jgi:hypothetical protein
MTAVNLENDVGQPYLNVGSRDLAGGALTTRADERLPSEWYPRKRPDDGRHHHIVRRSHRVRQLLTIRRRGYLIMRLLGM